MIPSKNQFRNGLLKYIRMLNQCKTLKDTDNLTLYLRNLGRIGLYYGCIDELQDILNYTDIKIKQIKRG